MILKNQSFKCRIHLEKKKYILVIVILNIFYFINCELLLKTLY